MTHTERVPTAEGDRAGERRRVTEGDERMYTHRSASHLLHTACMHSSSLLLHTDVSCAAMIAFCMWLGSCRLVTDPLYSRTQHIPTSANPNMPLAKVSPLNSCVLSWRVRFVLEECQELKISSNPRAPCVSTAAAERSEEGADASVGSL
jgi:hypothetical protein